MRHMAANMLSVLIVFGIVIFGIIVYGKTVFEGEGPLAEETTITIPRGATLRETTDILLAAGAIEDDMIFRVGTSYSGADQSLKFGEYLIPARASMSEILDLLVSGDTIEHRVTVAEGLTSWQIVEVLKEAEILTGELSEIPPEGSLAPNTYFVNRGDSREQLLQRMEADQIAILTRAWQDRAEGLPLKTPEEVLILASIVEKETGVPEERGQVASVFINRLKRGMKLQSDPTVIYGLTEGKEALGRGLRRSELDKPTPYNTYVVEGLPPTPIANPGRDAIMAVVNPDETPYYYFVADGTGGHVFAETYDEHTRNVARWREIERARQENQ